MPCCSASDSPLSAGPWPEPLPPHPPLHQRSLLHLSGCIPLACGKMPTHRAPGTWHPAPGGPLALLVPALDQHPTPLPPPQHRPSRPCLFPGPLPLPRAAAPGGCPRGSGPLGAKSGCSPLRSPTACSSPSCWEPAPGVGAPLGQRQHILYPQGRSEAPGTSSPASFLLLASLGAGPGGPRPCFSSPLAVLATDCRKSPTCTCASFLPAWRVSPACRRPPFRSPFSRLDLRGRLRGGPLLWRPGGTRERPGPGACSSGSGTTLPCHTSAAPMFQGPRPRVQQDRHRWERDSCPCSSPCP